MGLCKSYYSTNTRVLEVTARKRETLEKVSYTLTKVLSILLHSQLDTYTIDELAKEGIMSHHHKVKNNYLSLQQSRLIYSLKQRLR